MADQIVKTLLVYSQRSGARRACGPASLHAQAFNTGSKNRAMSARSAVIGAAGNDSRNRRPYPIVRSRGSSTASTPRSCGGGSGGPVLAAGRGWPAAPDIGERHRRHAPDRLDARGGDWVGGRRERQLVDDDAAQRLTHTSTPCQKLDVASSTAWASRGTARERRSRRVPCTRTGYSNPFRRGPPQHRVTGEEDERAPTGALEDARRSRGPPPPEPRRPRMWHAPRQIENRLSRVVELGARRSSRAPGHTKAASNVIERFRHARVADVSTVEFRRSSTDSWTIWETSMGAALRNTPRPPFDEVDVLRVGGA